VTRVDRLCVLVYLSIAIATAFADLRMRAYPLHVVQTYIPGVINGTEEAPGLYRVLAPFMIDGLARATGTSLQTIWYATRLLWFFAAYCAIHLYLRAWFPPESALTGVALTAAILPLLFTNSWAHPDHIPELALFTLAAWTIATGREGMFAIALALAALNRETSVFLLLLYFLAKPLRVPHILMTGLWAGEWFLIYGGLRYVRGFHHYEYWQLGRNFQFLKLLPANFDPFYRAYAYFGLFAFGPMIYLSTKARNAPLFVRRAVWVVPVFVAVALVFSSIIESRIFTPLFPLTLPAVMFCLVPPIPRSGEVSCAHKSPA
jgi:hypothetical protein